MDNSLRLALWPILSIDIPKMLQLELWTSISIGIMSRPSIGILKDLFVWHPGPSLSIGMPRDPSI